MMEADGRTCLTCFTELPASALSKCVIHSCCSRPVCSNCLLDIPRLATFCPFCEGVQHALRKGPRKDVIRAGQVIFDLDSAMMDSEMDNSMSPPAYEENDEAGHHNKFILEQEEEQEADQDRTPQLLKTSRLGKKQGPVFAQIDRSKSATMTPDSMISALPTADSLRQSLKSSGESSGRRMAPTNQPVALESDDTRSTHAGGSTIHPSKDTDTIGLTRQYWLRPNDTLMSLCLRFRVNAATVCKLNDLPLSTANTTPHLVHTRQFLLIPEGAIQSALSSSTGDAEGLQSALDGPAAQTKRQKIQRAQREAQTKFRAIITKNESSGKGKGRSDQGDVTLCDDRAAKAYISLMEAELRFVDFGDGSQEETETDGKEEKLDGVIEAARRERYNVIVKQAICRWEMDSDWERHQRAMGLTPVDGLAVNHTATSSRSNSDKQGNWLKKWTSSPSKDTNRVGWLEKVR